MKADQWCKHCHSYSRKGIVAKVQPIEYDASSNHYLDSGTGTQLKSAKRCVLDSQLYLVFPLFLLIGY
jgi:hypothetical protein